MTFAWYGHLKYQSSPLMARGRSPAGGLRSSNIALPFPPTASGSAVYSTAELKTMQEVITLLVFAGFSVFYLGEKITINHGFGFALICLGAFFVFKAPLAI